MEQRHHQIEFGNPNKLIRMTKKIGVVGSSVTTNSCNFLISLFYYFIRCFLFYSITCLQDQLQEIEVQQQSEENEHSNFNEYR